MIVFSNVSKIYNNIIALEDVSFSIDKNEFVFLVGPSGSGKTTVIRLIIKEEAPTEGNILFYDTDITQINNAKVAQLRREIGVVFQDFKLLPHKNLYENISFALEVSGRRKEDIEETVNYVLELVGLSDRAEAFPHEISGGEKQKIAIARAISNNPKVLIADEPTGNLDPDSTWEIINLLKKINEWGTTVIMATHGSDIVNSLGKRVIQLAEGHIVSDTMKGLYPEIVAGQAETKIESEIIPQITQQTSILVEGAEDLVAKPKQEKKPEKPSEKKEPPVVEKEFEITFTTKAKIPLKKKKLIQTHSSKENKKKKNEATDTKPGSTPKEAKVNLKPTLRKKTKKKKKAGKDVVDLHELELPVEIEDALVKADVTTIKELKKYKLAKLKKVPGINFKKAKKIFKALEKLS